MTALSPAAAAEESLPDTGGFAHLVNLLLDHVAPASYYLFGFMASARMLWDASGGDSQGYSFGHVWFIAQQALTTTFLALIVVLFIVRRNRMGGKRGLLSAIGALITHPRNLELRSQIRAQLLPALVALAGTNLLYVVNLAPVTQPDPRWTIPSAALLGTGLVLSICSLATLGRCFGVFPEARGLTTRGPYSVVRHPLYLAEIIAGLGGILPRVSPLFFLIFLMFVGLQYWRSVFEERLLTRVFPEYGEYRQRTWRILPGVW